MRVKDAVKMTWAEAPDTITPEDLHKITGIGLQNCRNIFDKPDFPAVSKKDIGNIGRADKEAARMYIQGIRFNDGGKNALLSMILFELKKINSKEKEGNADGSTDEKEN